jgi:hypothetical protein
MGRRLNGLGAIRAKLFAQPPTTGASWWEEQIQGSISDMAQSGCHAKRHRCPILLCLSRLGGKPRPKEVVDKGTKVVAQNQQN